MIFTNKLSLSHLASKVRKNILSITAILGSFTLFTDPCSARAQLTEKSASDYAHRAAIQLASRVNAIRNQFKSDSRSSRTQSAELPSPQLSITQEVQKPIEQTAVLYAHNAAVQLASRVNATRVRVKNDASTAADLNGARRSESRMASAIPQKRTARSAEIYSHHAAQLLASHVNATRRKFQSDTVHEANGRTGLRGPLFAEASQVPGPLSAQSTKQSRKVVMAAYSLRGTRYAMGGTSRSGFDCSGFVRYILAHSGGVDLPRTATEQYYHGKSVSQGELMPGDLVFFKNTYRHGISHVGIYAGDGKFIHAANSHKGVRMDELSSRYYAQHYAGARRVLRSTMVAADRLR